MDEDAKAILTGVILQHGEGAAQAFLEHVRDNAVKDYADLAKCLSDGLDLCVRARKLDAIDRTEGYVAASHDGLLDLERYAPRHNARHPEEPINTRSGTIALWVQEQYNRDLFEWEGRARKMLSGIT